MAQKKIEIIIDIDNKDIQFATDKTLTLVQQIKLLKAELQKTKEGTKEFEILRNKLNETQDQFARVNAKSRELFGTLSLIPGPIGEIAGKVNGAISLLKTFSGFSFAELKSQFNGLISDIKGILIQLGSWGEKTSEISQTNGDLSNSNEEVSSSFEQVSNSAADNAAQIQRNIAVSKETVKVDEDKVKSLQSLVTKEQEYRTAAKAKISELSNLITLGKEDTKVNQARIKEIEKLNQGIEFSRYREGQLNTEILNTVEASRSATGAIQSQTIATRTAAVAANVATASFRLLKGVLASLGIGLLILGITTLATKIYDWVTATDEADAANKKLSESLEFLVYTLDQTQQAIQDETKLLTTRAKIAGKSADEIAKIELNSYDKRIKAAKEGRERLEREAELILTNVKITEEQRAELIEKNNEAIAQNSRELTNLYVEQKQAQADEELRIAEEARKKQEKIDADKKVKAEKQAEQRKKDLEDLKEFQRQADLTLMEAKDREIAEINDKYNEQINLAKKYKQDTTDIEAARQKEIGLINEKYDKEALEKKSQNLDARIQLELDKETVNLETLKTLLQEKARIQIEANKLTGEEALAVQAEYNKKFNDAVKNQKEKELLIRLEGAKNDKDAQIQIYQEFLDELKTRDGINLEERFNLQNEYQNKILGLIDAKQEERLAKNEQANQQFQKYDSEYYDGLRQSYTQYQTDLDAAKEKGQITDDEYQARKRANSKATIDLDRAEQESKLELAGVVGNALGAVANLIGKNTVAGKALAIAQATIDTYAGAAKALATYPPPFGAIAAGTVILQGLLNVKQILSVKVPGASDGTTGPTGGPQFNTGTIRVQGRARGGMIYGPGTETSDSIPAMLSNGEFVINARSTRMFQPLLQKINSFGNDIPKFQMGGIVMGAAPAGSKENNIALSDIIGETLRREPIRTYVTSTDMSNQQQFDRVIKSRSLI